MIRPIPPAKRWPLVLRARAVARRLCPEYAGQPGACVVLAVAMTNVLAALGHNVLFQAGTMMWPRLSEEQDDGKESTHTHYSYVWEPDSPLTASRLSEGLLPEVHAWCVYLPGAGCEPEFIDLSTGTLAAHCLVAGMSWPGPLPPDYLWARQSEMDARIVYRAYPQARVVVQRVWLAGLSD